MNAEIKPLPPPSLETRRQVIELMNVVRGYVNLVLPEWSDQKKEVGTAVMLRAGKRLFAVTAEHCARQEMRLLFPLGEGRKRDSKILNKITQDSLDIALLELEDRSDVTACHIEQLCIELPKPPRKGADLTTQQLLWVVGYPAELAKMGADSLSVCQIPFGTTLVSAKPNVLALYYHEEAYGVGQNAATCELSSMPKTPKGFSGAGVWALRHHEDGILFNPLKHIILCGIQYAWTPSTRLVKCIPSRIIAEMMVKNYPDLKDGLMELFPTLAKALPTQ